MSDALSKVPSGQLGDYIASLQRTIGSRAIGLGADELKLLTADELEQRLSAARAEWERRQARPGPEPEPSAIDGWTLLSIEPGAARGTWDATTSDGIHTIRFTALSAEPKLAWCVEQIAAMNQNAFAINCEHCPDAGEPTRPAMWDEESD